MTKYVYMGIAAVLLLYIIRTYNSLVSARNTVKEAFASMDVYLKQRWDMIPNVVEIVKGYTKHEEGTFAHIVSLRNKAYSSMSMEEKVQTGNEISESLSRMLALSEAYPDLKASANFMDLSEKLAAVESSIASSRKYYNGAVKNYNNLCQRFPSNIIARIFGFEKYDSFNVREEERNNVQIRF